MTIVIDTDIFIDFFRGYTPSKKWFKNLDWKSAYFSSITEAELLSGKDCNDEDKFIRTLQILSYGDKICVDNNVARKAGEFRRKYGVSIQDSLIAATAFVLDGKVVTRNRKHFDKINEVKILTPYK